MGQTSKQKLWKQNNYQENKEYFQIKQQERRKEIVEFINSFKTNCIICNESDLACLDFHHIDKNEKYDDLANARKNKWSNERILNEMEKCVTLCSNCHRKLHYYDLTLDELTKYVQ